MFSLLYHQTLLWEVHRSNATGKYFASYLRAWVKTMILHCGQPCDYKTKLNRKFKISIRDGKECFSRSRENHFAMSCPSCNSWVIAAWRFLINVIRSILFETGSPSFTPLPKYSQCANRQWTDYTKKNCDSRLSFLEQSAFPWVECVLDRSLTLINLTP